MKKIYIIAILMVAAAIIMLTTAADDMSTYSTFAQAAQSSKKVKIAGQLSKDKEMIYNPQKDPNYFSFYINWGEQKSIAVRWTFEFFPI